MTENIATSHEINTPFTSTAPGLPPDDAKAVIRKPSSKEKVIPDGIEKNAAEPKTSFVIRILRNPHVVLVKVVTVLTFGLVDFGLLIRFYDTVFKNPCYNGFFEMRNLDILAFRNVFLTILAFTGIVESARLLYLLLIAWRLHSISPYAITKIYNERTLALGGKWTPEAITVIFKAGTDFLQAYLITYVTSYAIGFPSTMMIAKAMCSCIMALYGSLNLISCLVILPLLTTVKSWKKNPTILYSIAIGLTLALATCVLLPLGVLMFGDELFRLNAKSIFMRRRIEVGVTSATYNVTNIRCSVSPFNQSSVSIPGGLSVSQLVVTPIHNSTLRTPLGITNISDYCGINSGYNYSCTVVAVNINMTGQDETVDFSSYYVPGNTSDQKVCLLTSGKRPSAPPYQYVTFDLSLNTQCRIVFD